MLRGQAVPSAVSGGRLSKKANCNSADRGFLCKDTVSDPYAKHTVGNPFVAHKEVCRRRDGGH